MHYLRIGLVVFLFYSTMNLHVPGLFLLGTLLITAPILAVSTDFFKWLISSLFNFDRFYMSKTLFLLDIIF